MKRRILIVSILVICISMLATGSLAYFTSEGRAHNVITTGAVDIEVQEWADPEREVPFEDLDGVMPGAEITKIAEVKNIGASEAWIRVEVTKNIQLAGEGQPDTDLVVLDLNTADWTAGEDGYLYYNKPVQPGEVTAPVFTTVTFDADMSNEYQYATATVDVYAQAVQTANNGETAQQAQGWPAKA